MTRITAYPTHPSSGQKLSIGAAFTRVVDHLDQHAATLREYAGPAIHRTVVNGVTVETPLDHRQRITTEARDLIAALNKAQGAVPVEIRRRFYQAARSYAQALRPHVAPEGQADLDRTAADAERALRLTGGMP